MLTQPKVRHYRDWLSHYDHFGMVSYRFDEKSDALLDELFELVEQIAPAHKNGTRALWFQAERGPVEDYYSNIDELIEHGEYESRADFIQEWEWIYPDEIEWYEFCAVNVKDEGYRAITLGRRYVIVQDNQRESGTNLDDISEFVQWMIDSVGECIAMLRAGTYNDFVRENLPPQHRFGTITRKDYWDVRPEVREHFFKDISAADVVGFIALASTQPENHIQRVGRLQHMTANDFYRFCALGYAANNYEVEGLTPKEQ